MFPFLEQSTSTGESGDVVLSDILEFEFSEMQIFEFVFNE